MAPGLWISVIVLLAGYFVCLSGNLVGINTVGTDWNSNSVTSANHRNSNSEKLRESPSWMSMDRVMANDSRDLEVEHHGEKHHSIHIASWRWEEIGVFFTFAVFIVVSGLAKVAFHHAKIISEHIPESCLMIIVGVTVGGIIYACRVLLPNQRDEDDDSVAFPTFTPRLFFLILLPPVVLEASYALYNRAFSYNVCTVLLYAVVGTVFNTFTIGPLLFLLWYIGLMRPMLVQLTLLECLVFSALISAVDPVAVLAIFQEVEVNEDLYYLVFGESLFNDAVTIVLYNTIVTFCHMPVIPPGQYGMAVLAFFSVSLGGIAVGVIFGLLTALITKTTQECRVVEPLAVLGVAYVSYLFAELFHFSGIISIIICGLVQAHYALKNISQKSYITVKYFMKMLSSTCDAIIFLFLGMVLVSDQHVWHTGFVGWALLLCLVCRFSGVFLLTWLANRLRVKKINIQEQFIMAYGGLRGAIAFSMVEMLDPNVVEPREMFVTTTLVVIIFTVFIQGSTIKPLVALLKIARLDKDKETLTSEINNNVFSTMMAGIEEITGVRGDFYIRRKLEQFDDSFLKKIFLRDGPEHDIMRLYEKLCLTEHYAHLYGPATLIEDKQPLVLHTDEMHDLGPGLSTRSSFHNSNNFPGVELRHRLQSHIEEDRKPTTGTLRRAFSTNAYHKFHQRYNPNLIDDHCQEMRDQLKLRHLKACRITSIVAQRRRMTMNGVHSTSLPDEFARPRSKIESELEGMHPEQWEGIDEILDRTKKRIVRQRTISSFSSLKNRDSRSSPTNSERSEKMQPGGDAHHGGSSVMPHHSHMREQTLQNIAESDDVFSDEKLAESLV
uniref:Sodium/hydrogen exchanger n=1 Tax=Nasutitermes takasagoensis TaxID=62960 RepID=A0A140KFJ9_9NEOP|nr:NHE6/7 [Nasutitermes takasagoensis]